MATRATPWQQQRRNPACYARGPGPQADQNQATPTPTWERESAGGTRERGELHTAASTAKRYAKRQTAGVLAVCLKKKVCRIEQISDMVVITRLIPGHEPDCDASPIPPVPGLASQLG